MGEPLTSRNDSGMNHHIIVLVRTAGLARRNLRSCQSWKGRDDATSEWSYVAEKDCRATGVTEPGRHVPLCLPPSPRVARGDRAQQLAWFDALTMTRG